MKDYLSEINARFPIRRNEGQKSSFINYVCDEIGKDRVSCETLDKKHKNIIIGSISEAEVIFVAHYDTPAASVVPNLMMPANKLLSTLYGLAFPLVLAVISMALSLLVSIAISADEFVLISIYLALYFVSFYLTTRCFTNKNNINDNTSGVATVLSVAAATDNTKVAFILFDNEEKGLQGSRAFNKKHKDMMRNKLVVNFDCVGNGDRIVVVSKDAAIKLSQYDALKAALTSNGNYSVHYLKNKESGGNSDHKSFLCGVGVMACKEAKVAKFYTGRIHTARDTVANSENIYFLAEKMRSFIDSI